MSLLDDTRNRLEVRQHQPAGKPRPHPVAVLVSGACLYAAMLAGLASLHGVVEGFGWLFSLWFPLLLVHAAGALVRGSRWPNWLGPVAATATVALVLLLHPVFGDRSLGDTPLQRLGWMLDTANLEFATQVPEVAYTRAVDFAFLLLGLALSLLVELLAGVRRLAGLVILPLSFAPVLASLFKPSGAGLGYLAVLLAAMICYFAFLPHAWPAPGAQWRLPTRRRLTSTGLLAAATVLALLAAGTWMPGFRQGMLPEGSRPSGQLFASNIDPLLNLGRDLRAQNPATMLTYFTSAESAPYLRTEVISDLGAERWQPDPDPVQQEFTGTAVLRSEFMSFGAGSEVTEISWPGTPRGPQLPLPAHSYLIEGIRGPWQWQPQASIARFTDQSREATGTIRVSHSTPTFDAAQARRMAFLEQINPPVDERLTRLPQDTGDELRRQLVQNLQLAYGSAGEPTQDFDRAVAIQDYLRSRRFSYSEQTPLREGYDGANLRVVSAFLEQRAGYCVHFASTMALLARAAGIPSRVVVGYAPGEPVDETRTVHLAQGSDLYGQNHGVDVELTGYRVSGRQAHAWPELYLPGLGWTAFEPTPGRGIPPEYAPAPAPVPGIPDSGQVPPVDDFTEPEPAAPDGTPAPAPDAAGESAPLPWFVPWLGAALLLAGCALPGLRRERRRRTRLAAIAAGGAAAAQAAWEELRALGADYGLAQQPGASEADYRIRLVEAVPAAAGPLQALCAQVESSFYALRDPDERQAHELAMHLAAVRTALGRRYGPVRRMRAALWPASVLPVRGGPAKAASHAAD